MFIEDYKQYTVKSFFFFKPGLEGTSKVVSGVEPGVYPIFFELFILFYVFIYFWTQTLQWKHGVLTTGIPTREFPKCQILRKQLYMYTSMSYMGLPGGSEGKASACNAGGLGLIPMLRRFPGGGHGNPLQYSCLEESHGQRSLAGSSP